MTRQEFKKLMSETLNDIIDLFDKKQKSYGEDDDVLKTIKNVARRVFGDETPESQFFVAMILLDKHLASIAEKGLQLEDLRERLTDAIIYLLFVLAIDKEREEKKEKRKEEEKWYCYKIGRMFCQNKKKDEWVSGGQYTESTEWS